MRTYFFASIALAAAMTAGHVQAQDADLFGRLDKNGDGVIGPDEVEGDAKPKFERLLRDADANKDGKLSKEEFAAGIKAKPTAEERPAGERPPGERPLADPAQLFKRMDANGDGKISKDELPERLRENFGRIDADGNGSIGPDEFKRVADALRPAGPGAGQPGARPEMAVGAAVLRALDADGNGEISASEIADAAKALAKFDKNGDGQLDKEELLALAPRPEGRPEARPEARPGAEALLQRLKEADKNGDGKLSKEEAPDRLKEAFERIDADKSGDIDAEELRKFLMRP